MANLVSKAYDALDDVIMSGANKVVRAWNWTTGRTKADLANLTVILLGTTYIAGTYAADKSSTGVAALLALIYGKDSIKICNELGKKEERAFYSNCKDMNVEAWKETAKYTAPLFSLVGGVMASMGYTLNMKPNERIGMDLLGMFIASDTLAFYIMRTDYLPPRKNAFSRGLDKFSEFLNRTVPSQGNA